MILWSIVGLQEKLHAICFLDSYVTFAFVFESMHGIKYFPVEALIALHLNRNISNEKVAF